MPGLHFARATERLPRQTTADSLRLTTLVRCLVGHTVEEVERELILCSLLHYCGNRTCAAKILGISVRTMRNKISEYAAQGIAVPVPGQNQTSTSTEAPSTSPRSHCSKSVASRTTGIRSRTTAPNARPLLSPNRQKCKKFHNDRHALASRRTIPSALPLLRAAVDAKLDAAGVAHAALRSRPRATARSIAR